MRSRTGLTVRSFTPARAGELPPVLLVHGFASDGVQDWVETGIARALTEAGRSVIVPDLRGHGSSPAPSAAREVDAPGLVTDLVTVLDEAGADTFDVVGYSLGARLAWELPEAAPGRLRRAVLGGLSPAEPFEAVNVQELHQAVADGTEPTDPLTSAITNLVLTHEARAAGLALCVEGLRSTPFTPRSWSGRTPPVIIVGKDDAMARGIERVLDLLGAGELITVAGDHHEILGGAAFRPTVLEVLAR
ncbi:alpha/beta fold hydrolase [Streptomyces sp. B-S-A8]|uniref:Alpha/beta fold hydrolase n=1 Tax=Streptomyces solicavernae TaxID=3043614 RepID=A0ABT6RTN3_9ACTN|nr:alpha/beta fold hydrolase [Streptomyces sp. B-S-A8]MDI3387798.1 alpha/beta fold hydrolase [Streptomyces sp. B-S-A8]